jgi:lipopolysaccharide assembly outer membrane protein LptD (OstA)
MGATAFAQTRPPFVPAPPPVSQPASTPNAANPNQRLRIARPDAPGLNDVLAIADKQESEGSISHMRGHAHLETTEKKLLADEIDYDEDTGEAEARGHVYFENFIEGDKIHCDHGKYNVRTETGLVLFKRLSPPRS